MVSQIHGGCGRWQAAILGLAFAGWLALTGCSQGSLSSGPRVFPMGERVQAGPLIYTVLEAEWRDQLGEPPNLRTPQHRFLILRLSVTNSGITESGIPRLTLIGANDQSYLELANGEGVQQWLGLLRSLKAAATEHGRVLFDVPSGSYRLRVSNEAEPGEEKAALIDIPFQAPPAPPELPIRPPEPRPQ